MIRVLGGDPVEVAQKVIAIKRRCNDRDTTR
jgi:predicted fused transcriptional regulator/phosphomethylpyrimidine kinase